MAKILCVDDSRMIRNMLSKILEGFGHEVLTAVDGVDAMEVARENPVDMVLCDVNMPNMSGISLVAKLRRLDSYKDTPIVMVTTESEGYKKDKSRSVGANGWLHKPFTEEQVENILKRYLTKNVPSPA